MQTIEDVAFNRYITDQSKPKHKRMDPSCYIDWANLGAREAQRWFKLDEELPQQVNGFYPHVLVLNENYGLCSTAAYKDGRFIPDNPVMQHDEITHWRPIERR